MCINCMLCYAACPVVSNEPEFLGPAAIALGHRYNIDSRDEGARERNQIFRGEGTVFSCSYANECSEVCPEARRSRGRREPGQVQRGDRLGDEPGAAARREGVAVARPAHPHAMQPARPGRTRTAPPLLPDQYPFQGRYRAYTLFDLTGVVYFAARLRGAARGLGARQRPGCLAARCGAASRARSGSPSTCSRWSASASSRVRFFRLFPKSQPPRIGPAKPPPRPVIHAMLYAAWIGVTLVIAVILAGGIF